jgi:hypothetical protein
MKATHRHHHSISETSSSLKPYKYRSEKQPIREYMHEDVYTPHHIQDSLLSRWVLHTRIPKDYISTKMTLDNYNDLVDPREHVQNIQSNLELVIEDSYAMYKILLTTFIRSVRAWYNSLELGSITSFGELCTKLVVCFITSIPSKKKLHITFYGHSCRWRVHISIPEKV